MKSDSADQLVSSAKVNIMYWNNFTKAKKKKLWHHSCYVGSVKGWIRQQPSPRPALITF